MNLGRAPLPVAPMLADSLPLGLLLGTVVGIRVGQQQPDRPLVILSAPGSGDKITRLSYGTEPLLVEIVGDPELLDFRQGSPGTGGLFVGKAAEHQLKAIAGHVVGLERPPGLPLVRQFQIGLLQVAVGAAVDCQPLAGDSVPVLESAVRNLPPAEPPSLQDRLDGLGRSQPALVSR